MDTTETTERQITEEELSKDRFFERIGALSDEMIAAHGKDFTMGAFVLAARWIAEGNGKSRNN